MSSNAEPNSTPSARKPGWHHYCTLVRFPYHISFLVVLLGVATVTRQPTWELFRSVAGLYLSFNILLYGGIYSLHAISDAGLDRLHPRKCHRPIPSGRIPVGHAKAFGITMLMGGLVTGYAFFPTGILEIFIVVLLLNALYSSFARTVPYLDIAVNAATYPLRYLMGAILAGGSLYWSPVLLTFVIAAGGAALRRQFELARGGVDGRPVLAAYSPQILITIQVASWVSIGAIRLADPFTPNPHYWVAATTYAFLVLAPAVHEPLRLRWQRLWSA